MASLLFAARSPLLRALPRWAAVALPSAAAGAPAATPAVSSTAVAIANAAAGIRFFGRATFGFPEQKATPKYAGIHCHPGRPFGYKNPRKRQDKVRRLPNVRLQHYDFDLTMSTGGQFHFRAPFPPRVNRTIEVKAPWGAHKNPWPTTEHKTYKMQWKNIEYVYEPRLMRKPHGHGGRRWSGPVTRVEHHLGGQKTTTLVTHDRRLLDL
mmetsp:Transcript_71380/g.180508  ORF Transcript_71380/g.180508 Transcript_71380/m.180508 type:complete len:209 (-) Transcript_71380:78-704(-)